MAEFHVVIDGLELSDEASTAINNDIQKAVLQRLADEDLTVRGGHRGVIAFRPNPEWLGLVARIVPAAELRKITGVTELG
jgi:hypothetical protein